MGRAPEMTPRLAYRLSEAAQALGIGRTTIYRMIADGELETTLIRGLRRVPADALQRAIDAGRAEALKIIKVGER